MAFSKQNLLVCLALMLVFVRGDHMRTSPPAGQTVEWGKRPRNDFCEDAIEIHYDRDGLPGELAGTLMRATSAVRHLPQTLCDEGHAPDVWFKMVGWGDKVNLNTCDGNWSEVPHQIQVYAGNVCEPTRPDHVPEGSCRNMKVAEVGSNYVRCNPQDNGPNWLRGASLNMWAANRETYYIRVYTTDVHVPTHAGFLLTATKKPRTDYGKGYSSSSQYASASSSPNSNSESYFSSSFSSGYPHFGSSSIGSESSFSWSSYSQASDAHWSSGLPFSGTPGNAIDRKSVV